MATATAPRPEIRATTGASAEIVAERYRLAMLDHRRLSRTVPYVLEAMPSDLSDRLDDALVELASRLLEDPSAWDVNIVQQFCTAASADLKARAIAWAIEAERTESERVREYHARKAVTS